MASEKSVMAVIRAARPTFRNDHDKISFALYASFLASGYVLTATGPHAFADNALSSPSTDEVGADHWNDLNDEYAFVYTSPEKDSKKKVLVKCLVMNDILLVDALADGGAELAHLEIDVGDYVADNGGVNYSAHFKNLDKLVNNINNEILSKLDGGSKPSFSGTRPSLETSEGSRRNINDPGVGVAEPTGPQSHPSGVILPPVNPFGGSHLFPGSGAGMYPSRGGFGDGSMLVGPNDPRWFGGVGGEPGFPGAQTGVPLGARFDPIGPPGVPGFEPNRFARNPRRPGRGTHPDLEHFGSDTDFI